MISHNDYFVLSLISIDANEHDLELTKEDFHAAIDKLVPSVSPDELMYYKSVQNKILEQ